jgi:transposase
MDRQEAERIYNAGKEVVIETLLAMDARIKNLEQKIPELEKAIAALSKNSSNSSRPPSSDKPWANKTKRIKSGNRKQGGQLGHKGKKRELLPPEEMDHIYNIFPDRCECCYLPFSSAAQILSAQPTRHQVFDLPVVVPTKEEYRCHSLLCHCGHRTAGSLPNHIAQSAFGPRVHAAIAYLASVHHGSRRGIAEIMHSFFGLDISTGTICNAAKRVSEACAPVVDGIKRYTANAPALNIDETGWKSKGDRRYLWTFVSPFAVFFLIAASRGAKVLKEVLGDTFDGIITSDDHSAYSAYHKHGLRQLCWAHIIRKFKGLKDGRSSPDAYRFSKNMLKEIGTIFTYWHAFPDSGCSREQLWLATALIRGRMKRYCNHYRESKDPLVRTRAKRTLKNWEYFFTFLKHEGVEPTNNAAERAIRPAVQWRKNCFGSQSDTGERFTERLLTVVRTCQMHGVNAFECLVKIMIANSLDQHSALSLPFLP